MQNFMEIDWESILFSHYCMSNNSRILHKHIYGIMLMNFEYQ
jgi:hypothetical protein